MNNGCPCLTKPMESRLPEDDKQICKMQGHWLLARMGKRVLRPGGLELTRKMLAALDIRGGDDVVEFAPGLGVTARMTLERRPASYIAVERDEAAASRVRAMLRGVAGTCKVGSAEDTGLPSQSATVVYGEAMLTMHPDVQKQKIIREAARILRPGGRYALHEVMIVPDDADDGLQRTIRSELSKVIHVGASPATRRHWKYMLEQEGFTVTQVIEAPFHLLEPLRIIQDEGLKGAVRFLFNVLRHPDARRAILRMRGVFRAYRKNITAVAVIASRNPD